MPVNTRRPIIVNGTEYGSRGKAEVDLRLSTGTLSKKLKGVSLPVTINIKGKDYHVESAGAPAEAMTLGHRVQRLEAVIAQTFWMARRYANGRQSVAPSIVNDAYIELQKLGVDIHSDQALVDDGNSNPDVLDDIA